MSNERMKSVLLALALLVPPCASAQNAAPDARATASALLDHLDAGEYAQAEAMFGADMAAAVPVDKLKTM